MQTDLTGKTIKTYELIRPIGAGSFGEVYQARQALVNREVAIKIILPMYANHPDFIRRFEVEAQLVARLEHPFIVPLYDYWREPGGAYLVMRLLRGGSLRDLVQSGEELALPYVAQVMDQAAAALTVAHQNGVVHRDMKPANLLLDEQGNAYLADFGIAKDLSAGDMTAHGSVIGSPAYLSPEQVRTEAVMPQSDIYSLGVILYEMLAGEKPFPQAGISSLLVKQVNDPLPDIRLRRPDLNANINHVIQRATAKNPRSRFPNALTLAAAFRKAAGLAGGGPVSVQTRSNERHTAFDPTADHTQEFSSSLDVELPAPENPYKGLRAFQESDAADFFGREGFIAELLDEMKGTTPEARFLALVGPSGSGKSSVIRAGVIPQLRAGALPGSENWFITEMVPGAYPFEELEAALLRVAVNPPTSLLDQLRAEDTGLLRAIKRIIPNEPDAELFLLIDQFEEVFTLVDDEALRTRFLSNLVTAVQDPNSRLHLAVTIRADFLDKPLYYADFGQMLRQRAEIVLPLSPEDLEAAIIRPAERVGMHLEGGLAQEIIADVGQRPGALPLLQYALTELYERRSDRLLTIDAYRQIGGVAGALAQRAEDLYQALPADQQSVAQQVLLRLVSLGEGTEDTRRRAHQAELLALREDAELIGSVLNTYGKYRLLTFDNDPTTREPTVEVAHEALMRQWERYKGWIDNAREDLRLQNRLANAAAEWKRSAQDASYLATGSRLTQFEEWMAETNIVLTEREADYMRASIDRSEAERAAEAERQAREKALEARSERFLRALVAVFALGFVLAVALAFFALQAQNEAEENESEALAQRNIAEENASIARGLALSANARNALNENDHSLALALAIEAYQSEGVAPLEVERTLGDIAFGPGVRHYLAGHAASVLAVAFSPDGTRAASGDWQGTVIVWDMATGEPLEQYQEHSDGVTSLAFSADGRRILTGSLDTTAVLWDTETAEVVRRFVGHTARVNAVAFDVDGTHIYTGAGDFDDENGDDTVMRRWNIISGEVVREYVHLGAVLSIAPHPDGITVATSAGGADNTPGERDRRARLWNIETGSLVQRYEGFTGLPRDIAFSPDGEQLVAGTWDVNNSGTVRIFDTGSGAEQQRFFGHPDIVTSVAFLPSGEQVISAARDFTVRIWDIETSTEIAQFAMHDEQVLAMAVDPAGTYVLTGTGNIGENYDVPLTASTENVVRFIDLQARNAIEAWAAHDDWIFAVGYSPDGTRLASGAGSFFEAEGDNSVRIWQTDTADELLRLEGHTDTPDFVLWTPDGTQLFSIAWDGVVILWDTATGEEIRRYEGHTDRGHALALHPDGERLLSTGADGVVIEWDVATGEEIRRWDDFGAPVYTADYAPNGQTFLTGDGSGQIILWDDGSGEQILSFAG
ncbi:MAG: protein kinase domain-containing protein, partial [Anaerolineales bacterium]